MILTPRSTKHRRVKKVVNEILLRSKGIKKTSFRVVTDLPKPRDINIVKSSSETSESNNDNSDNDSEVDLIDNNSEPSLDSDTSSDNEEEANFIVPNNLQVSLASWSCRNNVSQIALSDLLKTIQPFVNTSIPLDARTLLKTPKTVLNILRIGEGSFYYFGLKESIIREIRKGLIDFTYPFLAELSLDNLISLSVGIDGLPLSRSSKSQFWPIMGMVDQSKHRKPFLIGIYHGYSKPSDVNLFFNDLVQEIITLVNDGILVDAVHYNLFQRVSAILADAPARAFLKQCVLFNAYYGCERCIQKGTWNKKVTLSQTDSKLRSDKAFRTMKYTVHHTGLSPFIAVPGLGLVSQVVLDHMHLIFLGVVRKLLYIWVKGKIPYKISSKNLAILNDSLISLDKHLPKEFHRRPRSVFEIDHYKATEYRMFILYTGLSSLAKVLDRNKYAHFLRLQCAMFILLSNNASNSDWNLYAKSLLVKVSHGFSHLYGPEFLVYNVHNLIHLADDALKFGNLNNVSCFPFENYMQQLKRLVRGNKHFIQQIVHRIKEQDNFDLSNNAQYRLKSCDKMYNNWVVSTSLGNNCFKLKNDKIVILVSIQSSSEERLHIIKCKAFVSLENLKNYPCTSSKLGIFYASSKFSDLFDCLFKDILCKYIAMPESQGYILIPML